VVDWKEVERLRSKGWDWSSIADEPRVKFAPPEGSGDAGRALKALYLNRKSQRSRGSRSRSVAAEDAEESTRERPLGRRLFVLGLFVVVAVAAWAGVALYLPSPFGILVPFFPDLVVGIVVGAALVGAAFVLGVSDFRLGWYKPVAVGLVVGLVGVGLSGYVAYSQGSLVLHPCTQYGNGWCKAADNSVWTDSNKPIVFFYGSAACPFCSASSWAIRMALQAFGTFSGGGFLTSSPTDTYPNTPEVTLYGTSLSSPYVIWDPKEDTNNQQIHDPAVSPNENSFVQTYAIQAGSSGPTIPFMVFGGIYMHLGTFTNPPDLCASGCSSQVPGDPNYLAYTPAQIQNFLNSQNGAVFTSIQSAALLIEAYLVKVDQMSGITPPAAVTQNPTVQQDLQSIP
jgi:Domain of unknown function (DUF929)